MLIKAMPEAIEFWKSINDAITKDLLEDEYFYLTEHDGFVKVRIAGLGAIMGGDNIGFADRDARDGGKWLERTYWVNGDMDETFTFVRFKDPTY
jgi:hypothetical protein